MTESVLLDYAPVIVISAIYAVYIITAYRIKPVVYKKRLWLPGWRVVYADSARHKNAGELSGKLLKSDKYNIQGKPDYIYNKSKRYVPVEIKSAPAKGRAPREGDVAQLAAYFLIIGEAYNTNVKYGYLVYGDCAFRIRNTRRLRQYLLSLLYGMRKMLKTGNETEKPDFVTCKRCVCRGTVCEWSR